MLSLVKGVDNAILRTPSLPVTKFDRQLEKLIEEMYIRMDEWNGIGLAAPQIGLNLRLFVMKLYKPDLEQFSYLPMLNSEIMEASEEMVEEEEGCLSIPKKYGMVPRHMSLTVKFQSPKKKWSTLKLIGLNARIVQHESDHLDGTLIADKVTKWTRPKA